MKAHAAAVVAFGCMVAPLFGVSRTLGAVVAVALALRWTTEQVKRDPRIRMLAVLLGFAVLLGVNWQAYRRGVSAGFDAAIESRLNRELVARDGDPHVCHGRGVPDQPARPGSAVPALKRDVCGSS